MDSMNDREEETERASPAAQPQLKMPIILVEKPPVIQIEDQKQDLIKK